MVKSYLCHKTDPHVWEGIWMAGWALLSLHALQRYRDLIPEDKDRQDKWDAAMDGPEKYVTLLVGQCNDKEQRAERDEENWHDTLDWERTTQNYFLAYHEVKAHMQWLASRPADAEAYKRFSVPGRAVFAVLIYVYWMIKNDVNKSSVRTRNNDVRFDLKYILM